MTSFTDTWWRTVASSTEQRAQQRCSKTRLRQYVEGSRTTGETRSTTNNDYNALLTIRWDTRVTRDIIFQTDARMSTSRGRVTNNTYDARRSTPLAQYVSLRSTDAIRRANAIRRRQRTTSSDVALTLSDVSRRHLASMSWTRSLCTGETR